MLNVVLLEPEIPPNTGNIARLCLATGAHLHLIKPLGFSLDNKQLQRAGMDYWPQVQKSIWENWSDFLTSVQTKQRLFFLTTKSQSPYYKIQFQPGDCLVFGRETRGLPESLLAEYHQNTLTIPMQPQARSLNLSTAVAIVLFEAVRQLS